MDFKHKIIQWNCRGLKPYYNEVSLLISEYNPSVFRFHGDAAIYSHKLMEDYEQGNLKIVL